MGETKDNNYSIAYLEQSAIPKDLWEMIKNVELVMNAIKNSGNEFAIYRSSGNEFAIYRSKPGYHLHYMGKYYSIECTSSCGDMFRKSTTVKDAYIYGFSNYYHLEVFKLSLNPIVLIDESRKCLDSIKEIDNMRNEEINRAARIVLIMKDMKELSDDELKETDEIKILKKYYERINAQRELEKNRLELNMKKEAIEKLKSEEARINRQIKDIERSIVATDAVS